MASLNSCVTLPDTPRSASAPQEFRARLIQLMQDSGLTSEEELAAATGIDASTFWRIRKAPNGSPYLPNLGTSALMMMKLARRNKPKARTRVAAWAEQTFEDLEQLCQLHEIAKEESARRRPAPELPFDQTDHQGLPDWLIRGE